MDFIGKYKIIKELGSGGFGAVYLAQDPKLNELVAIKLFQVKDDNLASLVTSVTSDANEVLSQRFLAEAKILRQLGHNPHIINVFDFDELEDSTPYYVMPYFPLSLKDELGSDATDVNVLAELPKEEKPRRLPIHQSLTYLNQLLSALKDVHQAGLVHRDIKPANVLLNNDNEVQLCDFGIAKQPDIEHSQSGVAMGSRNYMSPEQRQNAKHVDARSDIYSVGVLAYRMITGVLPEGRFVEPNTFQPNLSTQLNELILKALEQHKENRFQDAAAMLKALKKAQQSEQNQPNIDNEETSTWIGGNSQQIGLEIKAELKPLETKIIELLQRQGEVRESDKITLKALADIVDINEQGLTDLITQITKKQQNSSAEQKALIQWASGINKRLNTSQDQLDDTYIGNAVSAGTATTGKSKAQLEQLLNEKLQQLLNEKVEQHTAISESDLPITTPTKKSHTNQQVTQEINGNANSGLSKVAFIIIMLLFVSGGCYFGFTYYQSGQVKQQQINSAQQLLIQLNYKISKTGKLDNRTQNAIEAFEAKNQQALEARKITLTITTTPNNAKIALINIKESYKKGVRLLPGEYQIKISKSGYHSQSKTIQLSENNQQFNVTLKKALPQSIVELISSLQTIPVGSFQMGSNNSRSDEKPMHQVNIASFSIMSTEVTFAMWDACVNDKGCSHKPDDENWGKGTRPVINVSFDDITQQFIPWLNKRTGKAFRLPSEAQWEYAARAGSTTKYSWGDSIDCSKARYGYYSNKCGKQQSTDPVKSFNPNPWGLYDMHGNVWEWTQDCWNGSYKGAPSKGSAWTSGNCDLRVLRGGSWSGKPNNLRSAIRIRNSRTIQFNFNGFRLVLPSRSE